MIITIYGIDCTIPDMPIKTDIEGYGKPRKKQKFHVPELPESVTNPTFDSKGNPIWTTSDQQIMAREIRRCINGYWFYCNGTPTYICGFHYYYICYWTLENGKTPEYRDSDRRFWIFFDECYNDSYILGIVRGKKRREGATSQGSAASTRIATLEDNQRCGTISKTGTDAQDLFQNMIVPGFMALPRFLQPTLDGNTNPKTKLSFIEPGERGKDVSANKVSLRRKGRNSFIDFRNTKLNSYDSGRFSFVLIDEGGKWEDVPINKYLQIVQQVLVEGASKVGFCYMPTTVNPPNNGGMVFKKQVWDLCDQFKEGRRTQNRMVRYFQPAEDGYAGFIDEFGQSVTNPPTREQLEYLLEKQLENPKARERISKEDLAKGAIKYLDDQFSVLKSPDAIAEFKRMYPRKEEDMFEFDVSESPFNLQNILSQREAIKDKKLIRRGRLYRDFTTGKVNFKDAESGFWQVYQLPLVPNDFSEVAGQKTPHQKHSIKIGGDPFRLNSVGKGGSNGSLLVGSVLDHNDPNNTGLPMAIYKGRPKDKKAYFEEALMACEFWGCMVTFEEDATDDYVPYFREHGAIRMLGRTPDAAINITKPTQAQITWGVKSANPFQLAKQLEVAVMYIETYCHKIYFDSLLEDLSLYDHDERTARDETVAFMIWLLSILGQNKIKNNDVKRGNPWLQKVTELVWT